MSAPTVLPWTWQEVQTECERRDPVLLSQRAGIIPDAWQARVLRSKSQRILLNCSRQSGKSTITSVLALHTAIHNPESLILMMSRAERQSGELFRKFMTSYNRLGRPIAARAESALQLELVNGSRVVALPGKEETTRSFSAVTLLLIDEASRVDDGLYRSVRPMLAVGGGRLVGLSSPWGKRGWWYEAWASDEPWDRYEVKAEECPRIPAEFLAEEKRELPAAWYRQEYGCEFMDTSDQLFRLEDIEASLVDDVEPLFSGLFLAGSE